LTTCAKQAAHLAWTKESAILLGKFFSGGYFYYDQFFILVLLVN